MQRVCLLAQGVSPMTVSMWERDNTSACCSGADQHNTRTCGFSAGSSAKLQLHSDLHQVYATPCTLVPARCLLSSQALGASEQTHDLKVTCVKCVLTLAEPDAYLQGCDAKGRSTCGMVTRRRGKFTAGWSRATAKKGGVTKEVMAEAQRGLWGREKQVTGSY